MNTTLRARLYFTPAGKQNLIERRTALSQRNAELISQVGTQGRSGVAQISCSKAELQRQLEIEQKRLDEVDSELSLCELVYPPKDASEVAIGTDITIQRRDADGDEVGVPEKVHVGGHGSTDLHSIPRTVSYDSPLVRSLMGMTRSDIGEWGETRFENGKRQFIELRDIELPLSKYDTAAHSVAA